MIIIFIYSNAGDTFLKFDQSASVMNYINTFAIYYRHHSSDNFSKKLDEKRSSFHLLMKKRADYEVVDDQP